MIALVTGATAGIGKETALMLAKNGYDLLISGRRMPRLAELKIDIETNFKVRVEILNFDIRKRHEVEEIYTNLADGWKQIDLLVNNAGLASGMDFIYEGDIEDWEKMIDTNVKGLLYISRLVMPGMIQRKKGHIVNISSIAGKETYQKGNVYCATKHAVESITKAMRMELVSYGIKVTSVSPGAVETEFSIVRLGDEEKAKAVYDGYEPLTAKDIAEAVEFAINRPDHVNINDIVIMPKAQANTFTTHKNA